MKFAEEPEKAPKEKKKTPTPPPPQVDLTRLVEENIITEAELNKAIDRLARGEITSEGFEAELMKRENAKKQALTDERITEIQDQAIAASTAGALLGITGGVALDVALAELLTELAVPEIVPPLLLASVLAGGTFAISNQDKVPANVVRNLLSRPIKGLSRSLQNTLDDTVEEVKSIPDKVQKAAADTSKKTIEEIAAAPVRVAEGTKQKIAQSVEKTKSEITKSVEKTKKTVEGVVSLPTKTVEEVSKYTTGILPFSLWK